MTQDIGVVTAFLRHAGEVLVLRRSERVGSYRGRWAAVSGYLEGTDALAQALREVEEETGIDPRDLRLVRAGAPLVVEDPDHARRWVVHPFLFDLAVRPVVRLDWEHTESRWVRPAALDGLPTVPRLAAALRACWPTDREEAAQDRAD
jgi:8-oxo-dGTP pyrophosphatase MutT (NUDIX family)